MYTTRSVPFFLQTKDMAQTNQHESGRISGFRLQTSAYVTRGEASPVFHSRLAMTNVGFNFDFSHDTFTLTPDFSSSHIKIRDTLINVKSRLTSKSHMQLPVIITDDIAGNTKHKRPSSSQDRFSNEHQINIVKKSQSNNLSESSISSSGTTLPVNKSRFLTARLSMASAANSETIQNKRGRRFSLDDDANRLAMKISLPCTVGCCYCAYTNLMGPVRIYVTRADKPKKEPLLSRFKDGNGNPVIPVSRKSDVRGLVYDPVCHNFHPPIRDQKAALQVKKVYQSGQSTRQSKNR